MKKFALIVAGGSGNRMKIQVPKQFMEIHGLPVLMHTFNAFLKTGMKFQFVLVLPEQLIQQWKNLCAEYGFETEHQLAVGGPTRFHSVKNGLEVIKEEGVVFIHDGVRPLVSAKTIKNCYNTARAAGNALPVISPAESIREVSENKSRAVDRTKYFLVQTPQTFQVSLIKKAYEHPFDEKFTDDASVLENTGAEIFMVPGNRENIKITYPEDLLVAGLYLKENIN